MIKILHFLTDTNIGGAGRLLCNQIQYTDTKIFDIYVALPQKSNLISALKSLPCKVIECKHSDDDSFSKKAIFEDAKIIKSVMPDIVHSHASLSSRIAATMLKIPSRICTRHCTFPIPKSAKNPLFRASFGLACSLLSTTIIAVADSVKNDLLAMGCSQKPIKTVINGVPPLKSASVFEKEYLRAKYNLKSDDFVITILARLEEYKGHTTLLNAMKICLKHHKNFKLFIVGSGSYEATLKKLSRELEIEDHVNFLGFCNDVSKILSITDINVNCSYGTETSSLALSEGMSLKIPCVASDFGGNPHMVKNGINGLIYPSKNADALAECLIRLYHDKELYQKCSEGAYKRFSEEFDAKIMVKSMENIYKNEYEKHKRSIR